ncbi:hypothetical protein V5799_030932 [Amblyomma americanum]|uniref:Uncharacterized protein n=1 Tax=Amblyomma americanum TaxID=6943 RepID=A0AAQ4EM81_AMBAM
MFATPRLMGSNLWSNNSVTITVVVDTLLPDVRPVKKQVARRTQYFFVRAVKTMLAVCKAKLHIIKASPLSNWAKEKRHWKM